MSNQRKVVVYGASGYTGKIISESLAQRGIPFYMAGRTLSKLEKAKEIVEQRCAGPVDAELYVAAQRSFVELVAPLTDDQWATPVPCNPACTVRDVLSHVAGVTADIAEGDVEGAPPTGGSRRRSIDGVTHRRTI